MREAINVGEKDFSALVSKIKDAGADLVYYGGQHTEAGLIVRQMKDQGVTAVLMGGDGISNSEFGAIGGDAAAGTLMTSFPDPTTFPEARDVVDELAERNVPQEAVTMYAYAATQIIADAISKAKSQETQAVADYLHSGAAISTVLGPISYDAKGDIQQPGFIVFEWKSVDGKLQARCAEVVPRAGGLPRPPASSRVKSDELLTRLDRECHLSMRSEPLRQLPGIRASPRPRTNWA